MRSEDRRELIIAAAMRVFGEYGYVGATTDQVARAAGVSQPYVVRMFGTKENLYLEVLRHDLDELLTTFRRVLAEGPRETLHSRFGRAYVELLHNRGLLLSLMHGFILGSDPAIGPVVRRGFLDMCAFLRDEAGFSAEEVRDFLAGGMLINTLVGLRMADEYETDPVARELLETTLPEKLPVLLEIAGDRDERTGGR